MKNHILLYIEVDLQYYDFKFTSSIFLFIGSRK